MNRKKPNPPADRGNPKWPYPGDTVTMRARKIAWAYRAALDEVAPDLAKALDERFIDWNEPWVAPRVSLDYADEDWVDVTTAAAIRGVGPSEMHRLRRANKVRWKLSGRSFYFNVGDIRSLPMRAARRGFKPDTDPAAEGKEAAKIRAALEQRSLSVTVNANGRTVDDDGN